MNWNYQAINVFQNGDQDVFIYEVVRKRVYIWNDVFTFLSHHHAIYLCISNSHHGKELQRFSLTPLHFNKINRKTCIAVEQMQNVQLAFLPHADNYI
jgi:hypothetical protein